MKSKLTPLMVQYNEIKKEYRDGILFFQVGDFYETFYEDAIEVSKILNIALTTRDKGKKNPIPLAGVPIHAAETYISKLLQAGKKVIICDQVEDPSQAKGIVKRAVTDVITPGTTLELSALNERENNFILSIIRDSDNYGFSLLDVSTGDFKTGQGDRNSLENNIAGARIRELILPRNDKNLAKEMSSIVSGAVIEELDPYLFNVQICNELLCEHFGVNDLAGFDLEDKTLSIIASGVLIRYVKDLRKDELKHISSVQFIAPKQFLYMDRETLRNLEIFDPIFQDSPESTLIYHLDKTMTSAGSREIRSWLMYPLRDTKAINDRLDAIQALITHRKTLSELRIALNRMPDIERIVSRISTLKAGPRELIALADALDRTSKIAEVISKLKSKLFLLAKDRLLVKTNTLKLIRDSMNPDTPPNLKSGGVIKRGFDEKLDELIDISRDGKKWIARLQETERQRTGIPSLKVGYNKVFGYYIEVSRTHDNKIPDDYICKQTLVSAQRYITAELKEKENAILNADAKRVELEREIFQRICKIITEESKILQNIAKEIAVLDVISTIADISIERNYTRPEVVDEDIISITAGRHPVVEIISPRDFIPNDLEMRSTDNQVIIITGPNMGGKSTFIRQVALITVMAHAGMFVPASKATIGIVDRIFTRVGSGDNLAKGQSTFLVEMKETAKIINSCTSNSLVIMDEVGRGTSTLDGLSIAWAVTEYLITNDRAKPKTLFATHYHELTELEKKYSRVQNLRVAVKEWGDSVVFLYRIEKGPSDKSYGIHVAKLAGLPEEIISKANEILVTLEDEHNSKKLKPTQRSLQPSLFESFDPVMEVLNGIEIDKLRPVDALMILNKLINITKNGK